MENTGKAELTVSVISSGVWQINENGAGQDVDAYLIVGTERAALVDALMSPTTPSLLETVRSLTDKPVDVLITHIHPDHAGAPLQAFIDAGCSVFAGEADLPLLTMFGSTINPNAFKLLTDGQKFDLGGIVLETVMLPGHTHGSALFVDRENTRIFSGDTVGSNGIWMQLDHSTPLSVFADNMKALEKQFTDVNSLLIYPGHRSQSPIQLTGVYISDMRKLADMLVSGEMTGEALPLIPPFYNENTRIAFYGMVGDGKGYGLIYDITNIQ